MTLKFTASFQQEDEWIVATCLENGIASQGKTIQEALDNLKEALELYYEDAPEPPVYPQIFVTSLEVAV